MKTQMLCPLQQTQHMEAKMCWVFLVATMALVMPSVEESLAILVNWLV